MPTDFEEKLTSILNDAAIKLNLTKFSLNLNLNAQKGDGFLGEFYKVSIIDEETNTEYDLAVKRAPTEQIRREQNSIEDVYKNEIFFYSEIYPSLRRFQQKHQVAEIFNSVPEYITSNKEIENEIIVLRDITKSGYILREKNLLLDHEHAHLIFKTYGHFHAISFCIKEQQPEEFARLTKPLSSIWNYFGDKESFTNILKGTHEKACESLNPNEHGPIIEKFKKYVDHSQKMYKEAGNYKGQHFGILHGDCWSNNMMFKYQNGNDHPISMKLLDFQLVSSGTPVFDLSYFFYTGGCKELFDRLEEYLDIYYQSFSKSAKELGCDPCKLLPRNMLSEDWKQYSKFGMMLSIILTKIKLISKEDSIKMIEAQDNQTEDNKGDGLEFMDVKYDEALFMQRVRDIIIHMYEIDAL